MPLEYEVKIDNSGWESKSRLLKIATARAMKEVVDYGMGFLADKVTANLAGVSHSAGTPSPSPGQLPVTQITGHLHGAVRIKRESTVLGKVFVDSGKAPYAEKVHQGTQDKSGRWIMLPRRFFLEAVVFSREVIYNYWHMTLKKKWNEVNGDSFGI